MRLLKFWLGVFALGTTANVLCAQTNAFPTFEQVFTAIQQHAPSISSNELNAAAVRGLLNELEGKISLLQNGIEGTPASTNLLNSTRVFDKSYVYLRIGQVSEGLDEKVAEEIKRLTATNKVKGVVVDLRFAEGTDYMAAAKTADLFVNSNEPLMQWGETKFSANPKTTAIQVPTAVLVNSRTRGAAEAFAGALREAKVALLIGSTSAGMASVFKDVPMANGFSLRVASSPVRVGNEKVMSTIGLKPDIELNVSLENERSLMEDPYRVMTRSIEQVSLTLSTNEPALGETNRPRVRLNEAELVRRKREGLTSEEEFIEPLNPNSSSEIKVIQDPALARALDLLKGLALIHATK